MLILSLLGAIIIPIIVFLIWLNPFDIGGVRKPGVRDVRKWCLPEPHRVFDTPSFSADGLKFTFTLRDSCKVGVYDIGTESVVLLTPPKDSAVLGATFDSRSNRIAFILARQAGFDAIDYQLAISQIDGSELKVLTSSDTRNKKNPSFSPDGKKIVYQGAASCKNWTEYSCEQYIYEFDLESNEEKRIANPQATYVGPAYFLPGNSKFVTWILDYRSQQGSTAVPNRGSPTRDGEIFIVDTSGEANYERLPMDMPAAHHPKPLPSGEIAFSARVSEENNGKSSTFDEVFLWRNGSTRRLTQAGREIWDYAIQKSGQSVLLVTRTREDESKCELILWNVAENAGRKLKCDGPRTEQPLMP